jgi:tetratricopeptide (TPR) repeat protein
VQKFDAPLQQETTSSLEALKAYSLGRKAETEKGPTAALPFFQRAIELDPNFASAIDGVGSMYSNLGQSDRANEYITRAFNLRDRAASGRSCISLRTTTTLSLENWIRQLKHIENGRRAIRGISCHPSTSAFFMP